ncbi:drug/metabolite transporter (DMT)-like permease [Rhodoligotrophos appendicifer]|uniref:DMT family transporter n=1 Tax=Rhodoligotrophos appendicifer TaxID=987056 RepID=UPI0019613380|nr:DMT family transporter [Rhodoligotrophos appendicifer]
MRLEGTTLGVTLIVASVFMLSFGDAVVKQSSADFSLWQLLALRSLIAVPVLIGIARFASPGSSLWPKSVGWVVLRSVLIVLMWIAFYTALPFMSLSVAATALYTIPLFIAIFSAALIGEPVGLKRWLAILVGFVGVLVILRPAADDFSPVALLPVLAAALYALAAIVTRSKCAHEDSLSIATVLNLCLLLTGFVGVVAVGLIPGAADATLPFLLGPWVELKAETWAVIVLLGILMVAQSIGVAKAYQIAPPAIIGTFDYSYLVFAGFWGFVFFGEVPDGLTVIGIGCILAAGWMVVWGGQAKSATEPL